MWGSLVMSQEVPKRQVHTVAHPPLADVLRGTHWLLNLWETFHSFLVPIQIRVPRDYFMSCFISGVK